MPSKLSILIQVSDNQPERWRRLEVPYTAGEISCAKQEQAEDRTRLKKCLTGERHGTETEQSYELVKENIVTDISRHCRLQAEIEELMPTLRSMAEAICRDPADADDLVRETVTRTLASLDQFPEGMSVGSWMFANMYDSFRQKFDISK